MDGAPNDGGASTGVEDRRLLSATVPPNGAPPASRPAPRISVVVNTLNEELRLGYALRSVKEWADEIVVVDMHSDDRTAEIAASFAARVFLHERAGYADPARAYAVDQSTGDWILVLDADELIPEPLSRRLRAIAANDEADAVRIRWRNYLLGAAIGHTGWGPDQDRHVRFFRRGAVDLRPDVHDFLRVTEGARVLDLEPGPGLEVVHFNYIDVEQFVEKMNRYTSVEAEAAVTRGEKRGRAWAIWRERSRVRRTLLQAWRIQRRLARVLPLGPDGRLSLHHPGQDRGAATQRIASSRRGPLPGGS